MKKLILNMLLLFGITTAVAAQAYDPVPMAHTPANQPENNAYYNAVVNNYATEMYRSYWVWDKASSTWVRRVELIAPVPPVIITDPRYNVPYQNNNAGKSNAGTVRTGTKPGG